MLNRILISIVIMQIILVLWLSRDVFQTAYDVSYWQDRFEHSQWVLPLSGRSIGDDGLYAYIGYELAGGKDPTFISAEVPPVGKYLLGWSIRATGHFWWYTVMAGWVSLVLLFDIARRTLQSTRAALCAVLILSFDPLFFSQLTASLLDLTQLLFLLISWWGVVVAVSGKKRYMHGIYLGIAGGALGLAAQTKMPLIIPIAGSIMTYYLYRRVSFASLATFIVGGLIGYLLPYVGYFAQGHSITDFITIQKYMIGYYRASDVQTMFGSIFAIIFSGQFMNIQTHQFSRILEWWVVWPASFLGALLFLSKRTVRKNMSGIVLYIFGVLMLYALIPAYPRYLLVVFPLIYLLASGYVVTLRSRYQYLVMICIIMYGFANTVHYSYQLQHRRIDAFLTAYAHQYFHDVYQEFIADQRYVNRDRNVFDHEIRTDLYDAEIRQIQVQEIERTIPFFGSQGHVVVQNTYFTQQLGSFKEILTIPLVKKHSAWYVDWSWDIVMPGYHPDHIFTVDIEPFNRGSLIDHNGEIIAQDINGSMIMINPSHIDPAHESELLELIGNIITVKPVHIHNAYHEHPLYDVYMPVGSNTRPVTREEQNALVSYSGVQIQPYRTRVYRGLSSETLRNTMYSECCTRLYSPSSYHGVELYEQEYDQILSGHTGGSLIMYDSAGSVIRVLIDKDGINGTDVTL